jgi:hypothetical protein
LVLAGGRLQLAVEAVPVDKLPQYFQYTRVQQLTLWKIVATEL